jgi:tetratricopeptide (TPR) repeat protein
MPTAVLAFNFSMRDDTSQQGRYIAAETWFTKSLDIKERFRAQGERIPQFEFAGPVSALALISQAQGQTDEAAKLIEQAIEMHGAEAGYDDMYTLTLRLKAVLLFYANNAEQSLNCIRRWNHALS